MAERITVNSKKPVSIKENLISHKRKTDFRSNSSPVNRILYLQRTIGNQAVQRMVRSGALQAKLRIGQPGDVYEQEADRVANAVMMTPEPQVQRQLEEEEEEEEPIQTELNGSIQQLPEEEEEEELITPKVQEKLTMGSPGDVYEQEADRVAEAISTEGGLFDLSNMTSVQQKLLSSLDSRALGGLTERTIKPMVSTDTVGSKKLSVNRKQELPLQGDGSVPASIESRIIQSKGKGNPLPQHMQNYMTIQAGYDFSNVRVKADSEAAELNSTFGARAFANGSDIWLGKDEKVTDVKLMAHELTHVVQQGGARMIQPQSNVLSLTMASKGFMPKFMQTLTKDTQSNSDLFQKGILQFAKENPSERMTALQSEIFEGSRSGLINQRENAQTLRGCIAGCTPSSSGSLSQKSITVNVTHLHGSSGNISTDLTYSNNVFNQAKVKINKGTDVTKNETDSKSVLGNDLILDEFTTPSSPTTEEKNLFKLNRTSGRLTMYYVKGMSMGSIGEAFSPSTGQPVGFVSTAAATRTWPHELGHVLLDDGSHPSDADNFMAQTSVATGKEKMTTAQINKIRSSSFVK